MDFLRHPEFEWSFVDHFRRPMPWFEFASVHDLEDLSWKLGQRLRMPTPSINLRVVTRFAWDRMGAKLDRQETTDDTELLSSAARRLWLPTDGAVWAWHELGEHAVRIRMRDLIEFETMLWRDDTWLFDEDADWMLAGMHAYMCGFIDFRGASRSTA
jgi:hypothetical protein